jgi:alkylation response protein AidB-like acyl-CoA dehydrogenase
MTDTALNEKSSTELVDELKQWLSENWDPDLTVGEWWDRLGLSGWAAPFLPENAFGRGLSRNDAVRVQQEIASFGALAAPGGLGLLLAAPTIASHGTQEQIDLYVRDIVTGQRAWCQLFSEPSAGSDLAGLQTRAVKDGEEWVVNGQKVWTSVGKIADLGMLLARTNAEVPKHQGITYFALDMHQDGIDVRPLREMTGRAMFNEVFITDATVSDAAVIGDVNGGWAVANTTLMNERAGLGSGGGSAAGSVVAPGSIANQLGKRAGDFAPNQKSTSGGAKKAAGPSLLGGIGAKLFIDLAKENNSINDPIVRQDLMRLYTLGEIGRYNGLRMKAARSKGQDIPGMPNIAKLSMSQISRLGRDLGLSILGPLGTLHAYDASAKTMLDASGGSPLADVITDMALFAQAPPIYGGTDQVQRNIIGERVLGLPKEPNQDRTAPFSSLPKNN